MKKFQVFIFMFFVSFLVSCVDDFLTTKVTHTEHVMSSSSDKYLATEDELREAKEFSKDIINWQVARSFAVRELKESKDYPRWDNAILSERPVIIYDNTGAPVYYEFRVRKGGYDIGYISANANRTRGYPIAVTSEGVNDYSKQSDLKVIKGAGNIRVVSAGYPSVALAVVETGSYTVKGLSLDDNFTELDLPDEDPDRILENLKNNEDFRKEYGITDDDWDNIYSKSMEEKAKTVEFWDAIDTAVEQAIEYGLTDLSQLEITTDEVDAEGSIIELGNNTVSAKAALTKNIYILNNWKRENLGLSPNVRKLMGEVSCGGGAMAFFLAGYSRDIYDNNNLSSTLEWKEFAKNIDGTIGGWKVDYSQKATTFLNMRRAFSKYNVKLGFNHLMFKFDTPVVPSFYRFVSLQDLLKTRAVPLMTLNLSSGVPHWMLLYGAGDNYERAKFKLLFFRVTIDVPMPNGKRYFIDNGAKSNGNHFFVKNVNWLNGLTYIYHPAVKR